MVRSKLSSDTITLWTVQTPEAFEILRSTGILQGDKEHVMEGFEDAYDWMKKNMVKRGILLNGASVHDYPIWAWYKLCGKKPDLRTSGFAERCTPLVLLTLKVDPSRVLLSDFDLWHNILNNWYICETEEQYEKFNNLKYYKAHHKKTWRRVFKVFDKKLMDFHGITENNQSIQAVLWNISIDDVVGFRYFIAK